MLAPKLVGESVGLHPVWVIFALLAFGYLFGFVGLLVAVPVAATMGVPMEMVTVHSGDSGLSPMGGGSWGSRGAALGGEAALRASRKLRENTLRVAGAALQKTPGQLDIRDGMIVDASTGAQQMGLGEVASIGHFMGSAMSSSAIPCALKPSFMMPNWRRHSFIMR